MDKSGDDKDRDPLAQTDQTGAGSNQKRGENWKEKRVVGRTGRGGG
jgi:hypothetical protein